MPDMRPYDDRDGFIWFNGEMVPWRDAKLHMLSHGIHYASAVFEGERAYHGKIFKSREHSERLRKSAQMIDIEVPYSVDEIEAAVDRTPHAYYFQQAENGVYARQALLATILNKEL